MIETTEMFADKECGCLRQMGQDDAMFVLRVASASSRDYRTCKGSRSQGRASPSMAVALVASVVVVVFAASVPRAVRATPVAAASTRVRAKIETGEGAGTLVKFGEAALAGGRGRRASRFVGDNVQNYLMNFGYLPQSDLETGNLRSDDQLKDAIRTLQAFGNIEATGELDEKTMELLRKPRCGLPDIASNHFRSKRYALHGQKWHYTNLTWSLQTKYPRNLEPGLVRAELHRALSVWSEYSKLSFRETSSDRADILVYFQRGYHGDGYPFDGRGQILAHAFFPGGGRGGDAHFDEEEEWLLHDVQEDQEGTSLFAVAAHEFGHSLGLSHSSVQGALMYPWYQGLKPNFKLPDDDRHGIQQLYGAKEEKLWGEIPAYNPPQQQPSYPDRPRQHPTKPAERPTDRPRRPHQHPNYPTERPEQRPQHPQRPEHTPQHPNQPPHYPDKPPQRPDYPPQHPDQHPHYPDKPPQRPDYPPQHPDQTPRYPYKPPQRPDHPPQHPNQPPQYPSEPKATAPPSPPPDYEPETPTRSPVRKQGKPDTCDTSYDAISVIRREVFIFKNKYLWRIGEHGLHEGYPAEIERMWGDLPKNFTHVDAVYERTDKKIVFFIGPEYYLYDGNKLVQGYPKSLTELGLPPSLEKIDAAMVWGHNSKTYLYSGTMYWKLDEDVGKVELDYPRDMSMWKGIGYNIDAAFQWKDGKTYFFRGNGYWKFNDLCMCVENEQQMLSAPTWMGCPRPLESPKVADDPFTNLPKYSSPSDASASTANRGVFVIVLSIGILLVGAYR